MIPLIQLSDFMSMLPPECCDMIWELLPQQDLLACTKVCRHWAAAVTPLLYEQVVLETDDYFLQKFSQTMRNNPQLARFVRRLVFFQPANKRYAARVSFFMQRCIEPLVNLQALVFDGIFTGFGERLAQLEHKGIVFPYLREVRLGEYCQMPASVARIWGLPALESLQASVGDFNKSVYDFSDWPLAYGLKTLELRSSNLEYQSVSTLLSLAPGLRHLNYADYRNVNEMESLQDCAKLKLEQLANLESLMVGVISYSSMQDIHHMEITPERGHLQAMTNLTRLQKLDVSVHSLLGWYPEEAPRIADLVPPSLTRLTLNEDCVGQCGYKWSEDHLIGRLWDLFQDTACGQTSIKTVEIGPLRCDRWAGEKMNGLRQVIEQSGLKCEEEMLEGHGHYLKIFA